MSDDLLMASHMNDQQLCDWSRRIYLGWRMRTMHPAELINLIESLRRARKAADFWEQSWKFEHDYGKSLEHKTLEKEVTP